MSISSLASDVLRYIMRLLPPDQLPQLCRVSKLWNAVASDNNLWSSFNDITQVGGEPLKLVRERRIDRKDLTYIDLSSTGK